MPDVATTKSVTVRLRLTPAEDEDLRASAKAQGVSVSEYIRLKVWGVRVAPKAVLAPADYEQRVKYLAKTMPLSTAKRVARMENQ